MPRRNKTVNDPKQFIQTIQLTAKVQFMTDEFKAEGSREGYRTIKEETKIEYFWKKAGQWVKFSFVQSNKLSDVISDFRYQCKIFGLNA